MSYILTGKTFSSVFIFCLEKRRDIVFETDYVARGTKLQRRIIFTYYYVTDITESKNSLKNLSLHNARLEALIKILKSDNDDINELLTFTLNQAIKITDSEMGFLMMYNPELKKFTMHAWSVEAEEKCGVDIRPVTYELDNTGCWAEAVRQRRPYLINDYSAPNEYKRGVPAGHVDLQKFVTVPIIVDKEIKAVIGVANKKEDYGETDIKQLTVLTDALWTVVERKEHQRELIWAKE